jgi:hypothetical protein
MASASLVTRRTVPLGGGIGDAASFRGGCEGVLVLGSSARQAPLRFRQQDLNSEGHRGRIAVRHGGDCH